LLPDPPFFLGPNISACERLLRGGFDRNELAFLIEAIFSSEEEVKMICCLNVYDAQIFIDVIDQVRYH